ncbi:protein ren [Phytobacter palmae]|uniref:Protein ren n=1 Tax=Phytobacter palmae TaxID=1855371 RepID=A0ABU9VB25_9ENTR
MSAKTAIKKYLANHATFTSAEVSAATGISTKTLCSAAFHMCRAGELVIDSRNWRTVTYRATTDFDRMNKNFIFEECRSSAAMQRVLSVYGVRV